MKLNLIYEVQTNTHTHLSDIARGRDRFHKQIKRNYNKQGEIKWNKG
jgi:hypothetical protein